MRIGDENWRVLVSFFPAGWQRIALQSGAVERLRGFPLIDVLLRMLLLHVARGYSLYSAYGYRSGLRSSFPARPICLRLLALECLTTLADGMTYFALC